MRDSNDERQFDNAAIDFSRLLFALLLLFPGTLQALELRDLVNRFGTLHAAHIYDANSNRTSAITTSGTINAASVEVNGDDQLIEYGDFSYTYNAAGQLAQKTQGGQLTRYSYSVLGELQRVELPDGRAITYQYDALKRRIGRVVNGAWTHRFLWGGGPGPVAELDANGNTLTTFVYGTGIGSPDYMVRGAETFALIRDQLGSVRFVLNTADNAIAQELRYDPFGKVILDNPGFQQSLSYLQGSPLLSEREEGSAWVTGGIPRRGRLIRARTRPGPTRAIFWGSSPKLGPTARKMPSIPKTRTIEM